MATAQNQRRLLQCKRCNQVSVRTDYHEAGMTLLCMTCGDSRELTFAGLPYEAPNLTTGRENAHMGERLPRGLRTMVFEVPVTPRQSKNRGTVNWLERPPAIFKLAVNYYPNQAGTRWKIHSAEASPSLPDTLIDQDLVNLRFLLRDKLAEMLGAGDGEMQKACLWEINRWGYLAAQIPEPSRF